MRREAGRRPGAQANLPIRRPRRRPLLLLRAAVLLPWGSAARAEITATPGHFEFDFSRDGATGSLSFVNYNAATVTLDVLGTVPVFAKALAGQSKWSDLSAWSASATFADTFAATEAITDLATGAK